jgi:hypothetical protein
MKHLTRQTAFFSDAIPDQSDNELFAIFQRLRALEAFQVPSVEGGSVP